jgi:hypothetical protein
MSRLILGWVVAAAFVQCAGVASAASTASRRKPAVRQRAQPVDPTVGDDIEGDDPTVRAAAVEALGTRRGSIVVVDPSNGRVLTMVGQKLALQSGFIPCSTIKLVTALAALTEHVVERDTFVRIGRYTSYNLTTALARSNNEYFGALGARLGFERVTHYARMMGLGEKAGLDISGEQPGEVAAEQPKGGMILMTAYGEGFQMTPLELAGLLSAIANGGTLYYLQYPHSQEDAVHLTPQVKRQLDVAPNGIDDIKMGMRGAVDYGTARSAAYDPNEPILGKTGTCSSCCAASLVTTDKSSSVVTSPTTVFDVTISRSRRRMILPLRVFGSASVKRICSGLAKLPISCATHLRSSSPSSAWFQSPFFSVTKQPPIGR